MEELTRVDLEAPLAGHHILIDVEEVTFGLFADFKSGDPDRILDALAGCIKGGDLPRGTDRDGLRRLTVPKMAVVIKGVGSLSQTPKS